MLVGLYMGLKDGARKQPAVANESPVHTWPATGKYNFDIVGESHYQRALKALRGDMDDPSLDGIGTALIIPDNNNPHDSLAVRVTVQGLTIGHFSKTDARDFRERLTAMNLGTSITSCGVKITGGHTLQDGDQAHFGARLDLKRFG